MLFALYEWASFRFWPEMSILGFALVGPVVFA